MEGEIVKKYLFISIYLIIIIIFTSCSKSIEGKYVYTYKKKDILPEYNIYCYKFLDFYNGIVRMGNYDNIETLGEVEQELRGRVSEHEYKNKGKSVIVIKYYNSILVCHIIDNETIECRSGTFKGVYKKVKKDND